MLESVPCPVPLLLALAACSQAPQTATPAVAPVPVAAVPVPPTQDDGPQLRIDSARSIIVVTVRRGGDGYYWTGSAWSAATAPEKLITATGTIALRTDSLTAGNNNGTLSAAAGVVVATAMAYAVRLARGHPRKWIGHFNRAASLGYIDEVIHPKDTRRKIAAALEACRGKREARPLRKHGNIPL